jgi:photosystem II stability/assembly factor-like uncharacterized protein
MIGTVRHRPRLARLAPLALVGLALVGVGLVAAALATADDEPHPALPSKLAPTTLLLDAARAGERLVAVGAWGHVILSDDGGESWRQARSVPVQAVLTSVFFVDERQGWAAGHDAVILHSTDGGETWSLQHRDIESDAPLFSVWMADARSGLAVGAFGMALRTRDGGAHWEAAPLLEDGEDVHLNAIFPGPDGALFVAAEAGQLYRSVDGGERWEVLDVPYQGSLWGGLSTAEDGVLVFGMRGNVLRSDDAGGSFTAVDSGTDQSLGGGTVLADGRVVLAGLGGAVSVSRDGGRSFSTRIGKERRGANAVLEGAAGIWLFGEGGVRRMDRAPTPAPTER